MSVTDEAGAVCYTDEWEEELLKLSGGNEDDRELALTGTIPIRGWESGTYRYISILAMQTAGNRFYLQTKRMPQKNGYCLGEGGSAIGEQRCKYKGLQVQNRTKKSQSLYEESRRRNHYNERKRILYVVGLWKVVSYAEL